MRIQQRGTGFEERREEEEQEEEEGEGDTATGHVPQWRPARPSVAIRERVNERDPIG